jgi:sigma-B regulation protein RsbU (phosphoserine phosphatase)
MNTSENMAGTAAKMSTTALEAQLRENIRRHAEDMSVIIDEKLMVVQNITNLVAAEATIYMSAPQRYKPRALRRVSDREPLGGNNVANLYFSRTAEIPRAENEARIAANISDVFEQVSLLDSDITGTYLAGESGFFIITRSNFTLYNDYDARKRAWYTGAKAAGKLTWSSIYIDNTGFVPTINCAVPFYDQRSNTLAGIAGCGVPLSKFNGIIEAADPGENTTVFLLDSAGIKVFSSDGGGIKVDLATNTMTSENLLQSPEGAVRALANRMTAGESGVTELRLNSGAVQYAAFVPLSVLNWSLGVIVDERAITGPVETIASDIKFLSWNAVGRMNAAFLAMILALVVVSAVILVYRVSSIVVLSRRIAEPITALARQLENTGGDNLTGDVCVKSKAAEIQQLASSFNDMKKRMREYVDRLSRATAEKERMVTELELASRIQKAMLPASFHAPGQSDFFEISAHMTPAKEVGGDFYDFFYIDDSRLAVVIGDVSGKGISAAMFMVVAKTLLKNHLREGLAPEEAAGKLNRQLCENNKESMFVSLWAGVYNPKTGELEYVSGGHNQPLLQPARGMFEYVPQERSDIVVGIMDEAVYHKRALALKAGDVIFLYTDGITEAFDSSGAMYGETRLRDFLNSTGSRPLKDTLKTLHGDIRHFTAGAEQSDDITMLALRRLK